MTEYMKSNLFNKKNIEKYYIAIIMITITIIEYENWTSININYM
jgi:hypothetical protein